MSPAPTKRQLDAMLSVYAGKSPFAAPGSDGRHSVRNSGGAARRYQVRIDLSDDQCVAMWMEIIDMEHHL